MRRVTINPMYETAQILKNRGRQCVIYHRAQCAYFSQIMFDMFKHSFQIKDDHFVPSDFVVALDEIHVGGEIIAFCCCTMYMSAEGIPAFYAYIGGNLDDIVDLNGGLLKCLKCAIIDVINDEDQYRSVVLKSNGAYKIMVDFQKRSEYTESINNRFDDVNFHVCLTPEEFGVPTLHENIMRIYDGFGNIAPVSPSDLIEAHPYGNDDDVPYPTSPSDPANFPPPLPPMPPPPLPATTSDDSSRLLKRCRRE